MFKRYFARASNVLTETELSSLKEGILNSEYLGPSPLGKEFVNSKGFSIVFRREWIDMVEHRFPYLRPFLDCALFEACNAFYINPLILEGSSRVDPHIDCRLIGDGNVRLIPNLVSILYVAVPRDVVGGSLVLNVGSESEVVVQPERNEIIHFLGSLVHAVTELRTSCMRMSVVCEQYNLADDSLLDFPAFSVLTDCRTTPRVTVAT
ncbi:hypothetical protein WL68_21060 [Burkholderia cepacia]|uniref:2OG-Fe(II) oxygenase n=1 Tax=Burkholderia cepacia TaxID=292 RepID=UPI000753D733|nr:2OG-Fe(II) oxygenase [Burkholderia cepacia]KWD61902.1 hypothetical protein WL68_21060 [Burkholderia cepacia]KWD73402.1 hypothetical protein WL69_31360 [Burkholderia cepacia]